MPIQHAVLALLADGPSHGYELRTQFERSVGPQWGELNVGHVYQVLDRLVRDELVTRHEVSQADRPDKVVYRLTVHGEAELERWLDEPFVRQSGYRDDFFLKLFAAARRGSRRLQKVIRSQRQAYLGELKALNGLLRRHQDEPLVTLLVRAAMHHNEANLRTLDEAEQMKESIVESQQTVREVSPRRRSGFPSADDERALRSRSG